MTAIVSISKRALSLSLGLVLSGVGAASAQVPLNPEIQVGVVQRFGEETSATLTLEPLPGDQLTLTFETNGQPQTLTTSEVVFKIASEALAQPELEERIVLSTHRSFESAEDSANQWSERDIEVEIAQPDTWEVWADRATYSTPLVRRLLLRNLQDQGYQAPHLASRVLAELPRAAFIVDGFLYHRDRVEITSENRRIWVTRGNDVAGARLYGGDLRLQPNAYGTYTLVNDVPIETYLRGVVPHEIGLGAPMPTIEAQAILARTYALRNLRRFEVDDYQLCADTQCQVYWGLGGAAAISDQAIQATQGLVLTHQNELVDALYSSTTGGVTAPFSDVWDGPDRPYLKAVVDSVQGIWHLDRAPLDNEPNIRRFISLQTGFNEDEWDTFRWEYESSIDEISQDLKDYLQRHQDSRAKFTQIKSMEISERAASGRVQKLTIETDLGPVELGKDEIIRVMSAPRSLLFYVEPMHAPAEADSTDPAALPASKALTDPIPPPPAPVLKGYKFIGGGFGHGVGMSQTGAYRLGEIGWDSSRILEFYYPGTIVQPITPSLAFWRDPDKSLPDESNSSEPEQPNPADIKKRKEFRNIISDFFPSSISR